MKKFFRSSLNVAIFIVYTIILIIAIYFITKLLTPSYSKEYYKLLNENQELTATIEDYQKQDSFEKQLENSETVNDPNQNSSETDEILNDIFFETGNTYRIEDFTFYSDINCSKEITEDLTFLSYVDIDVELPNGFTVYLSRSREKGYVWSTEKPYFAVAN